tara:strand:+ start:645 stop:965 length:321 start_codon:yes stop_codon:yes gene_type:complete
MRIERGNKYSNRKVEVDGITFHSKKEGKRYQDLSILEKAGMIQSLELQPRYPMVINDRKVTTYVADFRYTEDGKTVVEDTKGFKTDVYKLKKKLMLALYDIEIKET